jgi:hypothetical protein
MILREMFMEGRLKKLAAINFQLLSRAPQALKNRRLLIDKQ